MRSARIAWLLTLWLLVAVEDTRGNAVEADLALVLAIDLSDSVDANEFRLQVEGLATALASEEVRAAIASGPRKRIALLVYVWAGEWMQRVVVPWTLVGEDAPLEPVVAGIRSTHRQMVSGDTAIGAAIDFALVQLAQLPFQVDRRVIDVSGDGVNSGGPEVVPVRDRALAQRLTINGLAIVSDVPMLDLYYGTHVAGGPGSFVIPARDFEDFERSMRKKLVREIESPVS